MGDNSKQQTTVQKADPFKPARPIIKQGIAGAEDLYSQGALAPTPYSGDRVAGLSDATQMGQDMILNQANSGQGLTGQAQQGLAGFFDGGYQTDQLEAVKNNALASAIPAATAAFSGSGMLNSSQAMDYVGQAAMDAVAPYEYDAFNNMQQNSLRAAAFAPSLDQAAYMPGQMASAVGGAQDAYAQNLINSDMGAYYEAENQPANNLNNFANLAMGFGGMGSSGSMTQTQPGASFAQQAGGAALGGLGTYGMLAANPVTAPFAIAGGLGAGLMGLF
jgi:hypothetical protein